MSRFDDAADEAAKETDSDFKKEREAILNTDAGQVAKLFPDAGDRAAINELMKAVKEATSNNEALKAYQDFAVTATTAGIAAAGVAFDIGKKLVL